MSRNRQINPRKRREWHEKRTMLDRIIKEGGFKEVAYQHRCNVVKELIRGKGENSGRGNSKYDYNGLDQYDCSNET